MKKIALMLILCLTLGLVPSVSAEAAENLFLNFDFGSWYTSTDSALQVKYPRLASWSGTWNAGGGLMREETITNSAPYALKVDAAKNNGDVYVYQDIDVLPATEYTLGFWFYGDPAANGNNDGNVRVKFEFYHKNEDGTRRGTGGSAELTVVHKEDGKWQYKESSATTPSDCNQVSVLIRFKSKALGYVDDASFRRTGDPQYATAMTDEIFYYKEDVEAKKTGKAEITMNAHYNAADFQAAISLKTPEGETVYESEKQSFTEGKVTILFPLSYLTQIKTAYLLTMQVYGTGETPVWEKTQNIYCYPRPSTIGADGQYRVNGQIFEPTFAYHVNLPPNDAVPGPDTAEGIDWFDAVTEAGVNVVQLTYYYGDPGRIKAALDRCQQYGIKALICLYRNNFSAGNNTEKIKNSAGEMVTNAENTPEVVKVAKDHPATFAYALKDEPFSHMLVEEYGELEEGYRLIRNEDDVHPVWIVDNTPKSYKDHAKYTDIIGIDPYPRSDMLSPTYVTNCISEAVAASDGKPVYALLQAFRYGDTDKDGIDDYFPKGIELRHMAYQALAAGAKAIGYYSFIDPMYENGSRVPLMETHLWQPITDFAQNEQKKAYAFFRDSQPVRTIETDEIRLQTRSFENKSYAVVMSNRNGTQENALSTLYGKISSIYIGTGDDARSMWQLNTTPFSVDIYELKKENVLLMMEKSEENFAVEAIVETENAEDIMLLAALYDENAKAKELLSVQFMDKGRAENGKLTLSGTVSVPGASPTDTLALFLLSDGLMHPIAKHVETKIGQ